jgi:tetratricopeptide (TPR) repeat protein
MKALRPLLSAALILALTAAGLELSLRGAAILAAVRLRLVGPDDAVTRVLCLGESTTFGAQVAYPAELEKLLNAGGRRYQVINGGVPGIDTDEILRRLDGNLARYRPHIVVAMMGANDRGTPWAQALARAGGPGSWRIVRLARLLASGAFRRPSPLEDLAARERRADAAAGLNAAGWRALRERRPLAAAASFLAALLKGSETARLGLAVWAGSAGRLSASATLAWSVDRVWDGEAYMRIAHSFENEQRREEAHRAVVKALAAFAARRAAYKMLEARFAGQGAAQHALMMGNIAVFTRQTAARAYWELGGTCRALRRDEYCLRYFQRAVAEADAAEAEGASRYDMEKAGRKRPFRVFYTRRGSLQIRSETRFHLARFLTELGREGEALEVSRRSFALDPEDELNAALLSRLLRERGRIQEARAVLERSLATAPHDPRLLERLAVFEESYGRRARAEELRARAHLDKERRGLTVTELNYRRLSDALAARGIPLVCVAYPRTRADTLRGVLAGRSGVYFVDNDRGFAEQIARAGVDSVFIDLFGGTFGHCTALGYRILARNVADGVLAAAAAR